MISIYQLKPKFQQLLMPILYFLHRRNISANQITLASMVWSMIIALLFWYSDKYSMLFLVLPIGLLVRMGLNALDGMMARKFNQTSRLGEVLNEIGDVISDVMIFLPLIKFQPESLYAVLIFITLGIINEYAGVLGKIVGQERRYDGPMGKSDRALLMGVYGLLMFFDVEFSSYAVYIFSVVNVLLVLSTYIRIKRGLNGE